jgi:PAS domain S-box-containing protein
LDSTLKLEHRIVRRDGEVRVIAVKIKIIKDAAGNILEYYGANQDITERKQADEKVRRSREEYKNLVNNIRFGVAHIDENYRIVTVNTEITRMIAKTEKDLVGKQCFREFENREEPCAHCPGKQAMATGRSFEVETWLKKLDGSEQRPVRIQAFAVAHSVDGMAKGFVEVVEDVSERRKADKEKASLQAQLLQSDKLAAIGRLASGVAHEINNPLTIILGLSQFYGNKVETDPTLRADMKEIETAAVRCRDIVASLLAYARNNNEVFISINANEAIEKSIGLVGHQMELNKIEIRKQLDAALPPVTGNLHQLIQVFINLMTNAADAMPDGGTLLISSERSGDRLLIKFADTGQGIPAKMLKEIFDPFFTTKPVGKGTGLGLSITARIVENHQGTIRVESEVGKGTVFTLSFPTALPATGK